MIFLCNSLNFLHYWYNPPFSPSFYSSFMVLISIFYVVSNCKKMVKMIFCSVNFSGFYLVFFVPFTKENLYQQYFQLHCTYKFLNYLSENEYFPVLAKTLIYTLSQISNLKKNPNLVIIILCFPYTFCNIGSYNHKVDYGQGRYIK